MVKLQLFQKGENSGLRFERKAGRFAEVSFFAFIFVLFAFFLVMTARLFQLTVVKGQYYRNLSEQNRIREIPIEAPRGRLMDRKGFVIASNTEPDVDPGVGGKDHKERITSRRLYQHPEAISSIIGYRQIADQNDIGNDQCQQKIGLGDKVGKKGVEKLYDCRLRGRPGKKLIETDARGRMIRTLTVLPPVHGTDVRLSIDLELQKTAFSLIKDLSNKAAVVAVVPDTGEVLASVSTPSFNSQDFEDNASKSIQGYLDDKREPLFNRVTEGAYPPGSIFKLVTAAAGLEEKAISERTIIEDTGTIKAGPLTFGNWYFLQYGKTDGSVDIVKAIKRSNDIYFYRVGEKTGIDALFKWSDRFGYGKTTGIGITEAEGLIPSEFWKKEVLSENWYLGDTYNLSIGQGYLTATPLQTLMVTAAFANGGYLCMPVLNKVNGNLEPASNPKCQKLPVSKKTLDLINEGMKQACSTGGTGWPLFDFKVAHGPVSADKAPFEKATPALTPAASGSAGLTGFQPIQTACKTGTAESHAKSGNPHAWITVYAPYENPEIAVTVLVEEGGQGSDVAGPIARDLLKAYFERSQ